MHGDFTLFLRKCGGKDVAYAANRLASLTGMRAGLLRYAIQFFLRASMRLYKKSG